MTLKDAGLIHVSYRSPSPLDLSHLPGWSPFFTFKGFHEDSSRSILYGSIVWTGIATFRSGRKERVWYRVTITIPQSDVSPLLRSPWQVVNLVEAKMIAGSLQARQFVEAGKRGILLNWWRRRARIVASVEWQAWDQADPQRDGEEGVRMRGVE
jgi:hypothetical protein